MARQHTCVECGSGIGGRVRSYTRYCGRACMATSYKRRLVGSKNPHFSDAGRIICQGCGAGFQAYCKTRRFCSRQCYSRSPEAVAHRTRIQPLAKAAHREHAQRPRKEYPSRPCQSCGNGVSNRKNKTCSRECSNALRGWRQRKDRLPTHKCMHCGQLFHSYTKKRLYCSYPCALSGGSSQRAGQAAVACRMKYGAKKDANHKDIEAAFKRLGVPVYDLSAMGGGVPDCIIWIWESWQFVEIKNPATAYGRRGLNTIQRKWVEQWAGGPVYIVKTLDDVIAMAENRLTGIEVVWSGRIPAGSPCKRRMTAPG